MHNEKWGIIEPTITHTTRSGKNRNTRDMATKEELEAQIALLKTQNNELKGHNNELTTNLEFHVRDKENLRTFVALETQIATLNQKLIEKTNRKLAITSSQPLFSGKSNENVDMWLFTTESNYQIANIPIGEYVFTTRVYLRDLALQTYRNLLIEYPNTTWDELKAHFKTQFLAKNINRTCLAKLALLRQTKDLQSYIEEFLYLINQTTGESEDSKVNHFVQNLQPFLQNEVNYREPATLQEAIQIARAFSATHTSNPSSYVYNAPTDINFTNTVFNRNRRIASANKWCSIHKINTHSTNECRLNPSNSSSQSQNNTNNSTNARNFNNSRYNNYNQNRNNNVNSQNQHNFNRRSNQGDQRNNNRYSQRFNTNNNNSSHQPNTLQHQHQTAQRSNQPRSAAIQEIIGNPTNTGSNPVNISVVESDSLLTTTAYINNCEIEVVIDTAATQSVIPEYFVYENKIPISGTIPVQYGNSNLQEIVPITKPIEISLNGHSTELVFVIIQRSNVLLGVDWLRKTRAIVNIFEQTLTFPEKIIHLKNQNNSNNEILITETEAELDENSIPFSTTIIPNEEVDNEDIDIESWNLEETKLVIPDFPLLSPQLSHKLKSLIIKYKDIFATSVNDLKQPCTIGFHQIDTGDAKPIYQRPYRRSKYENEIIENEVKRLLENNIIRHSKSPWSSQIVLIPKPDKTKRMCVNYKPLNKLTVKDKYPIPRVDEIFVNLRKSKVYSKLDFLQAYYQVLLDPSSIEKTAFSTQSGHYEFLRLPFGLSNAPSDFNRIMEEVFREFHDIEENYFDDSTVHSPDNEQHLLDLERIFKRLREINLKLNFYKCLFFQTEIKLFGHIVGNSKLKMDENKIKLIKNWPIPTNTTELSRFLGFTGYYRIFIDQFAAITASLNQLLHKNVPWNFGPVEIATFEFLKDLMVQYPILQLPNLERPFIIHCDASGSGLGAILAQVDEHNNEYVCEFASRLLHNAEHHYSITEKECLSVIWATKLFRPYIYGSTYTIYTDHRALLWLINLKDPHGRVARWSYALQANNAIIKHRPGTHHKNVDALSRLLQPILKSEISNIQTMIKINSISVSDSDLSSKSLDIHEDTHLLHFLQYGTYLPGATQQQNKRIHRLAPFYRLYENKIYYTPYPKLKSYDLLVPPIADRHNLILKVHELGHFKTESTCKQLMKKYYWKHMKQDVLHVINNCLPCLRNDIKPTIHHPALALKVNNIFDRIGIDLVFGLPLTESGFHGCLIITEYLSKFPWVVPIKSKDAITISRHLFKYISIFGPPKEILSDQGTEFCNTILNSMMELFGSKHVVTSPYHPQTNGLTERFNETLIKLIRTHAEANVIDWPTWLDFVVMAYRQRIHSTTKFSPYSLLFGQEMNEFDKYQSNSANYESQIIQRNSEIQQLVDHTRPAAQRNIEKQQHQQKINQDLSHNIEESPLLPETDVMVKSLKLVPAKLASKYSGPYTVTSQTPKGNYFLRDRTKQQLAQSVPRSRLKIADQFEDKDQVYNIEKILSDRVRNGTKEYYVKWKGYPESESSWVPEQNFTNLECLEDYKELKASGKLNQVININSITTQSQHKRLFKYDTNFSQNYISLIIVLTIINMIHSSHSMSIKDKFQYCALTSTSLRLDVENLCPKQLYSSINSSVHTLHSLQTIFPNKLRIANLTILAKRQNKVSGLGTQCFQETLVINATWQWYLAYDLSPVFSIPVQLTKEDCNNMQSTKMCGQYRMKCINNECEFELVPQPDWKYKQLRQSFGIRCSIKPVMLLTNDIKAPLFTGFGPHVCLPIDNQCHLKDSIIIWDSNILHLFPYDFILSDTFIVHSDNQDELEGGTIVYSTNNQLLLNVIDLNNEMEVPLYSTSEGLFIVETSIFLANQDRLNIKSNVDNTQAITQLTLSDIDYKTHFLLRFQLQFNKAHCHLIQSVLQMLKKDQHTFSTFYDINGNRIILYSMNNELFVPQCIDVNEINTIQSSVCYAHVPLQFIYNNMTRAGFVDSNRIISDNAIETACESHELVIQLVDSKRMIEVKGNQITLGVVPANSFEIVNFLYSDFDKINYAHNHELLVGVDLTPFYQSLNGITKMMNKFPVISFPSQLNQEFSLVKFSIITEIKQYIHEVIDFWLTVLGIVAMTIILIITMYCCCKHRKFISKTIRHFHSQHTRSNRNRRQILKTPEEDPQPLMDSQNILKNRYTMEQSWNVAPKESFQISKSNAIPLHDSNIGEPNLLSKDNAFSSEIKYLDTDTSIRYRKDNLS